MWYVVVNGPYKVLIRKKEKIREKTKKELNEINKRMLAQNIQVMDIICKALKKDELKSVKDYKSSQEIWRRLEEIYNRKKFQCSKENEGFSISNSKEGKNIVDLMVENIVRNLSERLKRANELNKTLKSKLNGCTLEKKQITVINEKLKLAIDKLNESHKEVEN